MTYKRLDTKNILNNGIVKRILYKINMFTTKTNIVYAFLFVYTGVYLVCECLQGSSLIKLKDHNLNTTTLFAYDYLFMLLVTYFLINQQKIATNINNSDSLLYWIFCILGGVCFALLGELPFLQGIVITKNWWKHLPSSAWICIFIIGFVIIGIGLFELKNSCKDGKLKNTLLSITLIGIVYIYILTLLISGKAKNIHYHVHHAIFAGVLSMWFIDWKQKSVKIMHAILMGIVVEGINFFGIGELFLFLTNGTVLMSYNVSVFLTILFFIIILSSYCCSII